ncbi:MAG: beta-glucuronidase, partial [Bacteroidales bacterium]|nr:beta-glucuronidase [Bacteroidales bacterium]
RSLGTPHRYDLTGMLHPGRDNELTILIDNRLTQVPVGSNSYSVSDNEQGNWNGMVGEARLVAQPATCILSDQVMVYPNVKQQLADVVVKLGNQSALNQGKRKKYKPQHLQLCLKVGESEVNLPVELKTDSQEVRATIPGLTQLWDEYHPHLYHLDVRLLDRKQRIVDEQNVTFGMREMSTDGHFVTINDRPVYLRGTVDGAQFPLTGYPPMDEAYWTSYLTRLKEWGINMVRFHSWCPPEAAFAVADSIGMYLQPECSSWPNHDVILSKDNATARYISQETEQILQAYGNHPSFVMLAAGNEPRGREWLDFADTWVQNQRERDRRRLYYAFSVGGSWGWCQANQVQVRAGYRGLDWHRRRPESETDFNAAIDTLRVPFIGHEVGQWSTYPTVSDIPKYTGLMRPSLLCIARDGLRRRGLESLADSFVMASGRLQVICYKHEVERLRRTRNYGGYDLQALLDYTGQGGAAEGVLNIFGQPKGYVSPQEWLKWSGEVVPLMRTDRFVYEMNDTIRFSLEVSNMGRGELRGVSCGYEVCDETGQILVRREYPKVNFAWGGGQEFGHESIALKDLHLSDAAQLTLRAWVDTCYNDWNVWVYPDNPDLVAGDVYVTTVPDAKAQQVLQQGGKVLILAHDQINYGRGIGQRLLPEFWNHMWMPRHSSSTHGLYIRHDHPIFDHFPTAFHSDVQWWELISRTYPMVLDDMPADVQPLVQSIDNAYRNLKIGMLIEVQVGPGRLVLTNLDLTSAPDRRIVARQLLSSILQYMRSDDFSPQTVVQFSDVMYLFTHFKVYK